MVTTLLEFVSAHRIEAGVCAALILILVLKPLVWWLFSFDSRIAALLHQKKSSEVRLGKITESLAPLLDDFPVDIHKPGTSTVFLGQPIDFIHFDPDEGVTFIEVKSGGARLNDAQRRIKELIESGAVAWTTYRVDGEPKPAAESPGPSIRRRRLG